MNEEVTIENVREAAERIFPYVVRTPVMTSGSMDALSGGRIFFKCENFQKAGAFKSRGASNAVFSLTEEEARRGVATHSSGNHAAALALAARSRGIRAYVVMPRNCPPVKKEAVAGYGADISFCEPSLEAREKALAGVVERTGASFVHPYDDPRVIAGQGTAAMELLEDVPGLDILIAPVGGGGLLSGTAVAARAVSPFASVVGAEPQGADDASRSFHEGRLYPSINPDTVADGLLTSLSRRTFSIIRKMVDDIVTVPDEETVGAMRYVWERMKIIIEPSSAVPVAAVMSRRIRTEGKRVGIIISGGNVDLDLLPWKRPPGLFSSRA